MSDSQDSLTKLKVPELKAKCKLLKIPNYSKLSKTDLIARILASGTDTTQSHPQPLITHPQPDATTPSQNGPNTDGDTVEKGKDKKTGGLNKKATENGPTPTATKTTSEITPHVPPTTESSSQGAVPKSDEKNTKEKEGGKERKSGAGKRKTTSDDTPSASTTSTVDHTAPGPAPKIAKKVNTVVQPVQRAARAPTIRSTGGAPSSASTTRPALTSKFPASSTTTPSIVNPPTPPQPKPKPRPVTISNTSQPRPQFKSLTIVRPAMKPTPAPPVIHEIPTSLDSPTDRITHLEIHFLNQMFINLHSNRIKPIPKPPYPTPSTVPQSSVSSGLAFQGLHPSFYTPNTKTAEEFMVGLRFWMARLHSFMQLGSGEAWSARAGGMGVLGPDMSTWPPVIGCRRVVKDIWVITTIEGEKEVRHVVVGCIGEVIGHSRDVDPKETQDGLVEGCKVRSDWAGYIANEAKVRVEALVKSKDSFSFPGGISRAWRIGRSEIEIGIAERAVLASCALNSFSGEKISAMAMDAAWLGRPVIQESQTVGKNGLELYLPESSQVMSVHRPSDIHPALAIIHRVSGYSEYVLADTGQIVGTEDEGVVPLWRSLLGCNEKGARNESASKGFWKGWESRMRAG